MKTFRIAVVVSMLAAVSPAHAGGGRVLSAAARPDGYSLEDMAAQLAYFSTSGNNTSNYPATPFQILYVDYSVDPSSNSFTVSAGTPFFVPVLNVDDSPPVLGNFPVDNASARSYYF